MPRQPDAAKERYWRRMVRRWRRSGLTVRQFCSHHHLSEPTFYAWRRTLAHRDQQAAGARPGPRCCDPQRSDRPAAFVPVQIVASSLATTAAIEVALGNGRVVRLGSGFDPDLLRQLLVVLEEPSC